jgi:hypothetical protein
MLRRPSAVAMAVLTVLGATACSAGTRNSNALYQPKNLASVTDVCQMLTPSQLSSLGVGIGTRPLQVSMGRRGLERVCYWSNDTAGITIKINAGNGRSPEDIVQKTQNRDELTQIAGYPGVRAPTCTPDTCQLEVGVAERQSFTVDFSRHIEKTMQNPDYYGPDASGWIEEVANDVVQKLPDA